MLVENPRCYLFFDDVDVFLLELRLVLQLLHKSLPDHRRNNPLHLILLPKLLHHLNHESFINLVVRFNCTLVGYCEIQVQLGVLGRRLGSE